MQFAKKILTSSELFYYRYTDLQLPEYINEEYCVPINPKGLSLKVASTMLQVKQSTVIQDKRKFIHWYKYHQFTQLIIFFKNR